ncbi:(2Fe-2S)-binding protein [Umezawaea beigongshangensis]|uniref:(2Fe-2S)-binding protein n=1 Tax=Umezawaea beigongshangensis TaxID=2780383 RepID=UPI0018F26BAA|nr:(2Fe-2S)-binding protein [Umezawaea beigongshangensis]
MSEFADVLATLRRIRGISPFFVLDVGRPGPDWLPGEAVLEGPALPGVLDAIGARYRTDERRVAASLFFLSWTARLLCPVVGAAVVDGRVLDVRPQNLWWRYDDTAGLAVRLAEPAFGPDVPEALAPVVAAVRSVVPVAAGLLWGNAASSIAGALRTVVRTGTATREECERWGSRLLSAPPLTGAGEFLDLPGDLFFRRRSCCLYYRLDGGGTCGDCSLPRG